MTWFFTVSLSHMCFLKLYRLFIEDVHKHSTAPLYCIEALSETDLPFKGLMAQILLQFVHHLVLFALKNQD